MKSKIDFRFEVFHEKEGLIAAFRTREEAKNKASEWDKHSGYSTPAKVGDTMKKKEKQK